MGSVNLSWTEQLKQLQVSSNYQVRQRTSIHLMTSDSLLDMTPAQKIALACQGHSSNIMPIHSVIGFNIGHRNHQSTGKRFFFRVSLYKLNDKVSGAFF
jgi:hypothetical protein